MRTQKALIAGHTGATGKALLKTLASMPEFENIKTVGRRINEEFKEHKKVNQIVIKDMALIHKNAPQIDKIDSAFCCIGTPFADVFLKSNEAYHSVDYVIATEFAKYAKENGATFFAIITGEGSDSSSKMGMTRTKGEVEDFVKTLGFERVAFLRPGFLNREEDAKWYEKIIKYLGMKGTSVQTIADGMAWMALNQSDAVKAYTTKEIVMAAEK